MIDKDGKVVKTIMRSFSLNEISAVDKPAQVGATVAILKRGVSAKEVAQAMAKEGFNTALTTPTAGHTHLINMGGGSYRIRAGDTSWSDGHTHPWLEDEAGNITIGHALGHNHGVEIVTKELQADGGEQADASASDNSASDNKAADELGAQEDQPMTPEEQKKAAEAAQKIQKDMEQLQKRAERAEQLLALTNEQREYHKSLKGDAADSFLALDESERNDLIKAATEANKVVYKGEDGVEYRKSDDARLVTLAKRLDEESKKRRESEARSYDADLRKRAAELDNLPGDDETRVAMLKALDSLPIEQRTKAIEALKAKNSAMSAAFEQNGHSNVTDLDVGDEQLDPLNKMAIALAKSEKLTFEQAYAKALDTPEGQKAYEKYVGRRTKISHDD
jgi:hypothetical protein